jgi:DDE superfamily endonuclease
MPRISKRQRYLSGIETLIQCEMFRESDVLLNYSSSDSDDDDDSDDSDDSEDDISVSDNTVPTLITHFSMTIQNRYLERGKYRSAGNRVMERDFGRSPVKEKPFWLNEDEFRQRYRMNRDSFQAVLDSIKENPIFVSVGKRKQRPVGHQLAVYMRFIGNSGTGSSAASLRNDMEFGFGSSYQYVRRVVKAINSSLKDHYSWPDPTERKSIANFFEEHYNLPFCVGIIDGMLHRLATKPQSSDAADYHGRKGDTLSTLIVSDHKRRIRYYQAGWPGSAHDNRILRTSRLSCRFQEYFTPEEYMLGDSAFTNRSFVVTTYKEVSGHMLAHHKRKFNEIVKPPRAISEHTNGILKGRFPYLREIRMLISDDPKTILRIVQLIHSVVLLHNFLINIQDEGDDFLHADDDVDNNDDEDNQTIDTTVYNTGENDNKREWLMSHLEAIGIIL